MSDEGNWGADTPVRTSMSAGEHYLSVQECPPSIASRRYFLGQCTGLSLGAMALDSLLAQVPIDIAPKAKRVIFLTQSGGPSQIELFDHKPGLVKLAGTEVARVGTQRPAAHRHDQGPAAADHALAHPVRALR